MINDRTGTTMRLSIVKIASDHASFGLLRQVRRRFAAYRRRNNFASTLPIEVSPLARLQRQFQPLRLAVPGLAAGRAPPRRVLGARESCPSASGVRNSR